MSGILQIGTAGLLANQRALDTIAQNIANSSNPDFNRQETQMGTRMPINMGFGFLGTGVEVTQVRRVVDGFVTDSMRGQQSNFSEVETFSRFTEQVANLLADSSIGISDGLNNFFSSLQELTNDPSSVPARQLFISNAQVLENRFHGLSGQIENQKQNANSEISQIVTEINRIAANIAESNVQITSAGGSSAAAPNDLLDNRDALILELSQFVEVTTTSQEDGSLNIFIGSGQNLVIGGESTQLRAQPDITDASKIDVAVVTNNASQVVTGSLSGGKLGGLLQVNNLVLDKSQNALGRIATTLALTLNDQHKLGVDLNGELGVNLFNDVNDLSVQFDRVLASSSNIGNGLFRASIDSISRPGTDAVQVFSDSTSIVDVGSISGLNTGVLSLNGINIRPTVAGDDTVSSVDNAASGIAIANAINASTSQHGVLASVKANNLSLGQFTPGAFAAGEFQVNGVNIVTAGTSNSILVQDINAVSTQTGVTADAIDGNIILTAQDGRNIQLTSNTNTPVATFGAFDTNSGTALNKIQRSGIHLSTTRDSIEISGSSPTSAGFVAGTTPSSESSLMASSYELSFDGANYRVLRLSDNTIVAESPNSNISVDGFTLTLESGTVQIGDSYIVHPVLQGAKSIEFRISDPLKLAMGQPVKVDSNLANKGNGQISLDSVLNTSGVPVSTAGTLGNAFSSSSKSLSPPIQIEFISPTKFKVLNIANGLPGSQIGPDQDYDPTSLSTPIFPLAGTVNTSLPGPNAPYTYDPGYRISLSGTMQSGDTFSVNYNSDGSGDNRNGIELVELQLEKLMSGNSANFQDSYVQIIGDIGTQSAQAKVNAEASETLLQSIEDRRNQLSGVNLDEEAANLIQFQQAYQAAAQIIVIARSTFDTMIRAFGG
jgi:flagellar hook-associated protein 1 FlgK